MNADNILVLLLVVFLFYAVIVRPLKWLFKDMFPKLEGLAIKTAEEMEQIRKIKLFNISDIKEEYKVLSMIESYDTHKEQAKEKLQLQALELGANAVINVTTNIDNNVKGNMGSVASMPRVVSGSTSTITTYHYEGTAVKLFTNT